MKFDRRVIAVNLKFNAGFFDVSFAPRLDGIVQTDLVAISALDALVSHAQTHMQIAAGSEGAAIGVRLFVVPVMISVACFGKLE